MKYAIFRKDKSYLFDIRASSKEDALKKAKEIDKSAELAFLIVPGNDLGCDGP